MSILSDELIDSLCGFQNNSLSYDSDNNVEACNISGCRGTCAGSCSGSCAGDCEHSCSGDCDGGCRGGCEESCQGGCEYISGL